MSEVNRLLVFDICGPMAHFRKFYTNSSSLSYSFPPRTVVMGMIAALVGWERDSYYERLNSNNFLIAVSIRSPFRRIMQTVNYLRTKGVGELNGSAGGTQVPLEILVPAKTEKRLCYRIYFWHQDCGLMDEISERLKQNASVYPAYLGLTEFIAHTSFVVDYQVNTDAFVTPGTEVELDTVLNTRLLQEKSLNFNFLEDEVLQYIKETAPVDFTSERASCKTGDYIIEIRHRKIVGKLHCPAYKVEHNGEVSFISFMEENQEG